MTTLHYAGYQPGARGYGWGTCNHYLRAELGKLFTLTDGEADVCFMPLADHDLNPATSARGKINLAYTFFEFELGPKAAENAAKYDTVFAGSTWCIDRLAERGIHNTALLIQGVDESIFHPQPKRKPDGQFRIFSGGKFEFRKGQDLVISSFREFLKTCPHAHLVCAWWNPWPTLINQCIALSDVVKWPAGQFTSQEDFFTALLLANGIPRESFTILPQLSHAELANEMANTDAGIFPNRCEGGTNLVLMEYAATGRPVIANTLTGHADVAEAIHYQIPAKENPETKWADQRVSDIVERMEMALHYRSVPVPTILRWSWADAATTVAEQCFTCVK